MVDKVDASYPKVELDGCGAGAVDACTRYVFRDHPERPIAHVTVTVILHGGHRRHSQVQSTSSSSHPRDQWWLIGSLVGCYHWGGTMHAVPVRRCIHSRRWRRISSRQSWCNVHRRRWYRFRHTCGSCISIFSLCTHCDVDEGRQFEAENITVHPIKAWVNTHSYAPHKNVSQLCASSAEYLK